MIFTGRLERLPGVLSIDFRLEGELRRIAWPTPSLSPIAARRHELWHQTCFELFFAIPGDSTYWEVNLSPDGSWNVYRFSAYRRGMEEESGILRLISQSHLQATSFTLSCRIDLSSLVADAVDLEVAVAGVVREVDGATGYWAIDHVAAKPDFHNRRSFLLTLAGMAPVAETTVLENNSGGVMKKIALLAYNGEPTCFAHVMLYALDFHAKEYEVRVVIEGAATRLITDLASPGAPFANLYSQLRRYNLIYCICKACSQKMGTLAEAERQGLAIVGDMQGHPAIEEFLREGFTILSL